MTKDRLRDLQKPLRTPELPAEPEETVSRYTAIPIDNESHVTEFLTQIDLIQTLIDKIDELAKEVKRIHSEMLRPMPDAKLAQELDNKTDDIKKLAYEISTKLKRLEHAQEQHSDQERSTAQGRIKESQIFVVTRRFRDMMNQYNHEFLHHRDKCKKAISHELEISGNRRTDNELEDMLENGYPGTFNFSMLVDTQKAKQALSEIEARQRDIAKLEQSMKELHSMFVDLASLVASQSELIDNIEHNVLKTVDVIEDTKEELEKAKKLKEAAEKKKIFVIIILVVIAIVLIFIIVTCFFIQKKLLGR